MKIAEQVGISRSTLYEELKRGTVTQINSDLTNREEYQRVYEENRQKSRKPLKIGKAKEFVEYAEEKILKEKWSPDIMRLAAKKGECVTEALEKLKRLYGDKFTQVFKSITADNGTEFAKLTEIGVPIYFAHPYSSWERGTNERQNGLVRYFIPKSNLQDFGYNDTKSTRVYKQHAAKAI